MFEVVFSHKLTSGKRAEKWPGGPPPKKFGGGGAAPSGGAVVKTHLAIESEGFIEVKPHLAKTGLCAAPIG